MEVISFDENVLRNQSIKRSVDHLYNFFYDNDNKKYQIVTIGEYYEANSSILNSYNNNSLRDRIEIVPLIYKSCMLPTDDEYVAFRNDYFKQIIYSYLFSQKLPLSSYRIDKETRKLIKPSANEDYEQMVGIRVDFNGSILLREELIKFLFQYYLKEISGIVRDLNDKQPKYFNAIKEVAYNNIQPNNITLFMNIVVTNYKRLIELYKVYDSDDLKKKSAIEYLLSERENLIKKIQDINEKIEDVGGNERGKSLTFSSGKESAKLFVYDDNKNGFLQNLLFIFLVGLTSGLSFFFISSLIKFILNRI